MTRRVALALAAAAAVGAVFLLATALDVQRWTDRISDDDVRFRTAPAARDLWRPRTLIPGDPAGAMLGIDDDLRYRDGVRAFLAAHPRVPAFEDPKLDTARVEAMIALRALTEREANDVRRSEAANLLGALTLVAGLRRDQEGRAGSLEAAAASFADAVRLDGANDDAKYNLENVLQRLLEEPDPFDDEAGGRRPSDEASVGGLRDPGSGY